MFVILMRGAGLSKSINGFSFYWMTILREVLFFFPHLQQQPLPGCLFLISLERCNLHLGSAPSLQGRFIKRWGAPGSKPSLELTKLSTFEQGVLIGEHV